MILETLVNLFYILASVLFIIGLKMLGSQETARKGNLISALGMFIAVLVTLFDQSIIDYRWILLGIALGSLVGGLSARMVAMTNMPEMVAVFNGFGGIASLLVAWAAFETQKMAAILSIGGLSSVFLAVFIGGVTFTGSLIAYGKLSEKLPGRPVLFVGQNWMNLILLASIVCIGGLYAINFFPEYSYQLLISSIILSFLFGILSVIPIGGADMPVVISLLNAYSGLAACAAGFIISNNVLIVSGALVGASGMILTNIMCKAMNRSLSNVLFSGFGSVSSSSPKKSAAVGEIKPINTQDAYLVLESAGSVCIVPGYGMAVAQAQHAVRELGEILEENGTEVKYAIHPVAGRMPGHMNVLLAEASVSYDQLVEPDNINPVMESVDLCIVIGANDVVNPAAREDESSPIYGMPVIDVDKARTVFVLKRSIASGFAGIENSLFYKNNTRMLFGDAKSSVSKLVAEFKS